MAIPKIFHQIWNTDRIPDKFKGYQKSWFKHHPDWTYRLWTLQDQRNFLKRNYSWFLPLYDAYRVPIKRADAFRYFALWHFGGVYADLDVEFLRPIDPLLANKKILLGQEPEEHLHTDSYKYKEFDFLLCNALMASVPGHSFWPFVIEELISRRFVPLVVNATGPVMLTDSYKKYPHKHEISLEPSEIVYPVSQMRTLKGSVTDSERKALSEDGAFTIHHWSGSWSEEYNETVSNLKCYVLDFGRGPEGDCFLKISCLMAYKGNLDKAKRAIHCFRMQDWPSKELLIVDDKNDDALRQWIEQQKIEQVRHIRLAPGGQPLETLKNYAAKHATGEYVTFWDEEDISSPLRLSRQMGAIRKSYATACILNRHRLWLPKDKLLLDSAKRLWEKSMLCRRNKLSSYPEICNGGDSAGIMEVVANSRVAVLDEPELLTTEVTDEIPTHSKDIQLQIRNATNIYKGAEYHCKRREMTRQSYLNVVDFAGLETMQTAVSHTTVSDESGQGTFGANPLKAIPQPTIHIMVPAHNSEPYLDGFFASLDKLIRQHHQISISFLDGNSSDNTYQELQIYKKWFKKHFLSFNVIEKQFKMCQSSGHNECAGSACDPSIMARMRNHLLVRSLSDEDFVLWLSPQLCDWQSDIIENMLSFNKDILTANCVKEPGGESVDLCSWKNHLALKDNEQSGCHGNNIMTGEKRNTRLYLDDLREHDLVQLDSVGCDILLVKAEIHRDGLIFPIYSYKDFFDTEGFSLMARDMGYECHGIPNLEVLHAAD